MLTNVFLHRRSRAPAMVVFCLVFTSVLIAQNGAGQLSGRVTDASGNAVANVTVTATSVDTGQGRTAATGTDGSYKFDQLPSGNYQVKFEAAGFNTVEIPSTTVSGTASAVVDQKLEAAANKSTTPQENLPNAPAARPPLRCRIWALLRSKPREIPASRPCSTSERTC